MVLTFCVKSACLYIVENEKMRFVKQKGQQQIFESIEKKEYEKKTKITKTKKVSV